MPLHLRSRRRFFRFKVVATDASNETTQIFEIDIQDMSTPTIIRTGGANTLTQLGWDMDRQCWRGDNRSRRLEQQNPRDAQVGAVKWSLSGTDADQFAIMRIRVYCDWWMQKPSTALQQRTMCLISLLLRQMHQIHQERKMFSYGCWCRQSIFTGFGSPNTAHWSWCRINFCSYIASTDQWASRSALMILTKTEISLTLMGYTQVFEWSRRCFCKCPCIYINRRRFFRCKVVATDAEGNETTQIFEIDIQDISTPTIIRTGGANTLTTTADMDSQCWRGDNSSHDVWSNRIHGMLKLVLWSGLSGTDADQFAIGDTGVLRLVDAKTFDGTTATNNVFDITVIATDASDTPGEKNVQLRLLMPSIQFLQALV